MPLYFVATLSQPELAWEAARGIIQESDILEVAEDKFIVKFQGTATELAEKLGYMDGDSIGNGIILLVSSYQGRAPKSVWEWIVQKQGEK